MNILLYDFLNSYIQSDLVYYLEKMGHHCTNVLYREGIDKYNDDNFTSRMERDLASFHYDLVMTTNFWPVVSKVCKAKDIKYVSWFFDSPPNLPTAECMEYECNRIYFFARADYVKYRAMGLDNVYYLPLAVNVDRLRKIKVDEKKYGSEISFVGKLYESMLPALMSHMDDYQKGYIDSVVKVQTELYGGYIIDDVITEDFAESVRKRYKSLSDKAIQVSRQELAWAVASHVTHLERMTLLSILGKRHQVKLYTFELSEDEKRLLGNVEFCGSVKYMEEMPQVFAASKINLCPVLKANRSGIPLRALDVMGCGGFLLSSYQSELAEYFLDGEECVMYESMEDAIAKADFYLAHEDLRAQIAAAGQARIEEAFRYEDRIEELLSR
jgi:spore maturation protein CgeB